MSELRQRVDPKQEPLLATNFFRGSARPNQASDVVDDMKYDRHYTPIRSRLFREDGEKWTDGCYHHFCCACDVEVALLKLEGEIAAYCPSCVRWWVYIPSKDSLEPCPPPALPNRMEVLLDG